MKTIGIVLSASPTLSETFIRTKLRGLKSTDLKIKVFVESINASDPEFEYIQSPLGKKNLLFKFFSILFFLFKIHFNNKKRKQFWRFYHLKKTNKEGCHPFKSCLNNLHILSETLEVLHFEFLTFAIGREELANAMGAKCSASVRGFDISLYPLRNKNPFHKLWGNLDQLHAISNALHLDCIKEGLSNEIPYQIITPAVDINLFARENNFSSHTELIRMGSTGRLVWQKGFEVILKACKDLKEKGLIFEYEIIGDGPEKEKLQYLIRDYELNDEVNLLGKVNHSEVKKKLEQWDLYLQPSHQEGFCNAVLEAQAMGVFCVVSNAQGLPENVLHDSTGYVCEKNNTDSFVQAIIKFSKLNKEERQQYQRNAVRRVINEFSLESQAEKFYQYFKMM